MRQLFKGDQATTNINLKSLKESVSKVTYEHARIFLIRWLDNSPNIGSILQKRKRRGILVD